MAECRPDREGRNPDWLTRLQDEAWHSVRPLNCMIELTLACNVRCTHCYNFDRDQPRDVSQRSASLSLDEIRSSLDELRELGGFFLGVTGGEALVHPNIFEVLDHAAELGFSVQLLTNGTLLSQEKVERLSAYDNLYGVSVSLYGASAAIHNHVMQSPGAHEKIWTGVRALRDAGVFVTLKYVLMDVNAHEAAAMIEQGVKSGFHHTIDPTITARHDGSNTSLGNRVSLEVLENLYSGPFSEYLHDGEADLPEEQFHCNCGRSNLAITATGNVQPCISVPWTIGNIREQSLTEIWNSAPGFEALRKMRLADFEHCDPCEDRGWCRRSPGSAVMESGDFTGIDPWVCGEAEIIHRLSEESRVELES